MQLHTFGTFVADTWLQAMRHNGTSRTAWVTSNIYIIPFRFTLKNRKQRRTYLAATRALSARVHALNPPLSAFAAKSSNIIQMDASIVILGCVIYDMYTCTVSMRIPTSTKLLTHEVLMSMRCCVILISVGACPIT